MFLDTTGFASIYRRAMLANSWNFKRFGSDSTFCETKLPPAKPSFEDFVLLEQVDHSGLLVTLEPTSDGDHQQAQGLDRRAHDRGF